MTISLDSNKVAYTGNGVTTVFPFSFRVDDVADLQVYLFTTLTQTLVLLTQGVDYTVAGVPGVGSVTYNPLGVPLPSTKQLIVVRVVPVLQDLDINNQGGFFPEVLEQQLDNMVMVDQQLEERLGRAMVTPLGQTPPTYQAFVDLLNQIAAGVNVSLATIATALHLTSAKATPVDADEFGYLDSAATFGYVKATWANIKAAMLAALTPSFTLRTTGATVLNRLTRYADTAGTIKQSTILVDDTGNVSGVVALALSGALSGGTSFSFSTTGAVTGTFTQGAVNATGQVILAGAGVEVGINRTVDGPAVVDLHGYVSDGDYSARMLRNTGANGSFDFVQTGTGGIKLQSGGGNITFDNPAGYATGAGGAVVQATSKATGVTLNKPCGQITMNAAALAASTAVSFVLTNSFIEITDVLIINFSGVATPSNYVINPNTAAGSATITVFNRSGGSLSEALVIQFALIKSKIS